MTLLPGSTLVYRCSFEVEPSDCSRSEEPWKDLVKTIRKWVKEAPASRPPTINPAYGGWWFYGGGQWQSPGPGFYRVVTARYIGSGDENNPEHWAMQYEHGCDTPGRNWRTDIAVSKIGDCRYRLTVNVSHYMQPGFFQPEDDSVGLTVPRIVRYFFRSRDWKCFSGSEELAEGKKTLAIGHGPTLREILTDPKHKAPVVLVSRLDETEKPLLDSSGLARGLTGAASVYESASTDVDDEIRYLLGDGFRCDNGSVRVYFPPVSLENPRDSRRHPYKPRYAIQDVGSDSMQTAIISLIVTRPGSYSFDDIESTHDVERFAREARVLEFSQRVAEATADNADVAVYEELLAEAQEDLNSLTQEAQRYREEADFERLARQEAEEDARQEGQQHRYWKKKALDAEALERSSRQALQGMSEALATLPTNGSECHDAIVGVFDGRIAFTERGRDSLRKSGLDVGELWTGLYHMATTLHDVLFAEERPATTIAGEFQSRTGLELAMAERKLTNKNPELAALRVDTFDGRAVDVTPHVKFDKNTTRAYFCKFDENGSRLVVIGYVGHLDTSGTHKMS